MKGAYLFDIGKIVEGAVAGDHEKVIAYVEKLSERLEADGEADAALRLRQILRRNSPPRTVGAAKAAFAAPPPVPVDTESRLPIADVERLAPGDVRVLLPPEVGRVIDQFLLYFRRSDRLAAHGVGVSPSVLLYGPPGCGKTRLARFIAAELSLPLVTARTDGVISSYLGSTAKNIRQLFHHAMSHPCVLFLDEFDAIAKMRDDSRELGELKRVVISLLQNIDALGPSRVLVAATNHEHLLDPAIWRRFTYKVRLSEPDRPLRVQLLQSFFGTFGDAELSETLASLSEGLTGADLREVAEECIRAAVLADRKQVTLREGVQAVLAARRRPADGSEQSLVDQIKQLRDLDPKRFTQARLAELFGRSQSTVSRLLRGGGDDGQ